MHKLFGLRFIYSWLLLSMLISVALIVITAIAKVGGFSQYLNDPNLNIRASLDGIIALGIYIMVSASVFSLSLASLIGLLSQRAWGRIMTLAVAGFQMFIFPLGTFGGFMIIRYFMATQNAAPSSG